MARFRRWHAIVREIDIVGLRVVCKVLSLGEGSRTTYHNLLMRSQLGLDPVLLLAGLLFSDLEDRPEPCLWCLEELDLKVEEDIVQARKIVGEGQSTRCER